MTEQRPCLRWLCKLSMLLVATLLVYVGFAHTSRAKSGAVSDVKCDGQTFHNQNRLSKFRLNVAPPLLSTSVGRVSSRCSAEPLKMDRTSDLGDRSSFNFVHISKCGGASFIEWAIDPGTTRPGGRPLLPNFSPPYAQGVEEGNLFRQPRDGGAKLVLLRSPRRHVMSMFRECRFNTWGRNVIRRRKKNGLRTVPHTGTHGHDFRQWVDYFLAANDTCVLIALTKQTAVVMGWPLSNSNVSQSIHSI